jgi:hypothetical protein
MPSWVLPRAARGDDAAAIKLVDAEGRSCVYVPITQNGKVADSQGFPLDPEDERSPTGRGLVPD